MGPRTVLEVVMVLVMAVTGAWAQHPTETEKYSYMKVMMACLGSRAVIEWRREMVAAMEKCNGGQVAIPPTLDLTQYLESIGLTTPVTPTFIQLPVYQAAAPTRSPQFTQVVPQYTQLGQLYTPYQYNNLFQYYQPSQYALANQYLKGFVGLRARRGTGAEAEEAQLKEALTARLSNVTCILREVKMLDAEDQVNYDHVRQEILGLVAGQLREELGTSEGACRAFSRCLPPPGPAAHPVARHLGPAVVYYRCLAQKMMAACMRNDLRKLGTEIGWVGGEIPLIGLLETPILQQVEDIMLGPSGIPELLLPYAVSAAPSCSQNTLSMAALRIAFIGAGNMAQALAKGFISSGLAHPQHLVAACPPADQHLLQQMESLGCAATHDNCEAAAASDVVVICVKPTIMGRVLQDLLSCVTPARPLVTSVALGVTLASMEAALPPKARVVRIMPNTPALVQLGASVFCRGTHATHADAELTHRMLKAVGQCDEVPEYCIDAVTGLSGAGPAYMYLVVEALADGGVRMGLPRDLAQRLAAQTMMGAAKMVLATGKHPGQLKDEVCSPGGCTIQGVQVLEVAGLRSALISAVQTAAAASIAMGKPSLPPQPPSPSSSSTSPPPSAPSVFPAATMPAATPKHSTA